MLEWQQWERCSIIRKFLSGKEEVAGSVPLHFCAWPYLRQQNMVVKGNVIVACLEATEMAFVSVKSLHRKVEDV